MFYDQTNILVNEVLRAYTNNRIMIWSWEVDTVAQ